MFGGGEGWTNLVNVLLASLRPVQGAEDHALGVEHGDDGDLLTSLLHETGRYVLVSP